MDFSFLKDINVLTFLLAFVVFGFWQILKVVRKKDIDARIITSVNGAIAVIYAVIVAGFLGGSFFDIMVQAGAVFAAGSFYDLLKAYGILKK